MEQVFDLNPPIRIPLQDIDDNPYQMRTAYDDAQLTALAASIQEMGLLQIPRARKVGDRFQLAFGHRRKRAFEHLWLQGRAAFEAMPLIVEELSDREMLEISVAENLKRADLSPIEKAKALKLYMDKFGANSKQAAQLFGIPEGTIRGTIRLLKLPEEAQQWVRSGQLSQTGARRLLEKPETEQKRLNPNEDNFDLRAQLMILLYGRTYSDLSDQAIFKKVRDIWQMNQQLERQVELMNGQKRADGRLPAGKHALQRSTASR